MHSRIYQVSAEPISPEDRIDESKYYDNFVGEIADYVSEIGEDVDDGDIKWLGQHPGIETDPVKKTVTVTDKTAYFAGKYKTFQETLDKLKATTPEEFQKYEPGDKLGMSMFILNEAYSDKFGFYMDDNGEWWGLETVDDWVRHAETGKTYYLGTVVDYHY